MQLEHVKLRGSMSVSRYNNLTSGVQIRSNGLRFTAVVLEGSYAFMYATVTSLAFTREFRQESHIERAHQAENGAECKAGKENTARQGNKNTQGHAAQNHLN